MSDRKQFKTPPSLLSHPGKKITSKFVPDTKRRSQVIMMGPSTDQYMLALKTPQHVMNMPHLQEKEGVSHSTSYEMTEGTLFNIGFKVECLLFLGKRRRKKTGEMLCRVEAE
jgi:hypothetical protein